MTTQLHPVVIITGSVTQNGRPVDPHKIPLVPFDSLIICSLFFLTIMDQSFFKVGLIHHLFRLNYSLIVGFEFWLFEK